jgi:hypothetical protein
MSSDGKNTGKVDGVADIDLDPFKDKSLIQLINIVRLERTNSLTKQKKDELKKLTSGQSTVSFANNLRRIFALGADPATGEFKMTDELRKQLDKAMNSDDNQLLDLLQGVGLRFEVNPPYNNIGALLDSLSDDQAALKAKITGLGIGKGNLTDAQLKGLNDLINNEEHADVRNLFKDNKMLKSKDVYSKAERESAIESIRLFVDQQHSLNDMSIQSLIRLESEMDQTYQYLMTIVKTLSDTLRTIARNIRGG